MSDTDFLPPDWTKAEPYAYTEKLSRRDWAWEFLRRNPDFRAAWRAAQTEYGIAGYAAMTTIIVSQYDGPSLARFGCLYSSTPDQNALAASVIWDPQLCSSVLTLNGFAVTAAVDATPFLLRQILCPSLLLEMPDCVQHLLFAEDGRGLQLRITGADVMNPLRLMIDGAPDGKRAGPQLRALHCFNDLRLTGRLYASHFRREPLSPRLGHVLRVLDGQLAGASHREIAQAVWGKAYTNEHWQAPGRPLRDRIRRALYRGRALMQQDYRDLLS